MTCLLYTSFLGRRFLIAEDNDINAEILCGLLDLYGAEYTVEENGEKAVSAFSSAAPGTYDAIIMAVSYTHLIFEPFSQEYTGTTSLYGGTGLGLAISKNIVDMMDGNITVRSIKDIGTEFTIDVKLGISDEELLHHKHKKITYNFSHLKTLVVDDDVTVCESAVVTLKEMGVKAEWVDSGIKAIERVKEMCIRDRC